MKKTVKLVDGSALYNVDLTRWAGDQNFYKVFNKDRSSEMLVNVNQIAKIEDYIEPDLSLSKVKIF